MGFTEIKSRVKTDQQRSDPSEEKITTQTTVTQALQLLEDKVT